MIADPGNLDEDNHYESTLIQTQERDLGKGRNVILQWMRYIPPQGGIHYH